MSRILVVEDQSDMRRLIRWSLQGLGHEILEAVDGRTGLQVMRAVRPDLIILDVLMPGGPDGLDVCRQARADMATRCIPVLMLTVLSRDKDRLRCMDAGATGFLAKPFRRTELLDRVARLLESDASAEPLEAP